MTTYYSIHISQNESEKPTVEENSFPEIYEDNKIYEDINDACDALDELIRKFDTSFVSPYRNELIDIPENLNNVFVYHMIGDTFFEILRRKIVPKKKKEEIREIPNLEEIARLLQKDYKFKKVSVVEDISNCSYNVKYYPQDDDTITYFLSLILEEHCKAHVLLSLHKEVELDRYVIYMAVKELETSKKYVYQYYVRNNVRNDEQTEMKSSPKYQTFDEACDAMDKKLRELHGENWQPRMNREQCKNYIGDDDVYAISYDFFKTDTYVLFRTEVFAH